MILIFIFLNLLFFTKKIEAKSFSYQFVLANNLIDLDFFEPIDLSIQTSIATLSPAISTTPETSKVPNKILSFDYKLQKNQDLPVDLPLFVATFGQEVIFSADASLADGIFHHVELDLESFEQNYFNQTPVFYQNNYLSDFSFEVKNLFLIEALSVATVSMSEIQNFSAIREKDQSLTIIFALQEEIKTQHLYQLFCLNEQEEIIASTNLTKKDNFLWSSFSFLGFFANQKNELIFNIKEFNCDGSVYVTDNLGAKSDLVSIIKVENL